MSMPLKLDPSHTLPRDFASAALAGRVWRPELDGPAVVAIRPDGVYDISTVAPTMTALAETADPAATLRAAKGERIGTLDAILANSPEVGRDANAPWLLAPTDLAAIKAAGVTFARSLLERVIEEQAKGAPEKAHGIRQAVEAQLGGDLKRLKPGSKEALALKAALIKAGAWSQYLEVGIGEDAEIFTKAQPMSPTLDVE
jgi:fumarylacetoacetate (FAA) hydrolase family protein